MLRIPGPTAAALLHQTSREISKETTNPRRAVVVPSSARSTSSI
jgi:hypothetical protein